MVVQTRDVVTMAFKGAEARSPAIRLEGGLLGPDILEQLRNGDLPGQKPADFGLPDRAFLLDEIAATFEEARQLWAAFQHRLDRLPEDDPATRVTREVWMRPFLGLLGYEIHFNHRDYYEAAGSYPVSHRAGESLDTPPVHIVGAGDSLDRIPASGRPRMSPHALLQEFLNRSDHLWGIVTNGRVLRLLRTSTEVRRQSYVEFDLEAILAQDRFKDFVLLYRLLHRTRLPQSIDDAAECWLERYHREAVEQGNRVRDRLRESVEEALKILGTALLRHAERRGIRVEDPHDLHRQLLRLVYRFLFLLVAEERGLLGGNDLYRDHYSISRLRRLVDNRRAYTDHEDLWHSLRVLWALLRDDALVPQLGGRPKAALLGLPVLNGELFEPLPLDDWSVTNRDLLRAFYHLVYYYDNKTKIVRRVNYAALDVEELGSVYESLLDLQPQIMPKGRCRIFTFVETGTERRSTGSYYTPHELVDELIRSALDPVIEERLEGATSREEREHAILSIKVVDPAAGSGHFLLAAARRLGKELARVRTGEEEPAPEAVREAVRDVIAHCIYGVDKNPMAVELCKVALWIEGHTPGKPLTFLDHHIKCGDSLVGVLDLGVLRKGVPDEAFKTTSKDDKAVVRKLKKRNKLERRGQLSLFSGETALSVADLAQEFASLAELEERTAADVRTKAALYEELHQRGSPWWTLWMACNLWTAPFFTPFTEDLAARMPTTAEVCRFLAMPEAIDPQMVAWAESLAYQHRFFHWPLEFPEVFAQGGFDVVLGNPPFMGAHRITTTHGQKYFIYLTYTFPPTAGKADICAYFYRRSFDILKKHGHLGMVATNTISQGDTRKKGLLEIVKKGGSIIFARKFIKWPGAANVEVNLVALKKGKWAQTCILNGESVPFISSRLDTELEQQPRPILANRMRAIRGVNPRGVGFILPTEEAEELIVSNPRNRDCLFPFLTGNDLNSNPTQSPSRWIINFFDWPLEKVQQYPALLRIVVERVKPQRDALNDNVNSYDRLKRYWWQYEYRAEELDKAFARLDFAFARSRVSELHMLARVPKGWVYAETTVVFTFDDYYHFALLQSSVHEVWLRKQASSLRTDIRYTPSTCFDTFPFPPEEYRRMASGEWRLEEMPKTFQEAARIGAEYHEHRRQIMLARQIGLTKTYNLFHDPSCQDADIVRLRELHAAMDHAILACYDWEDLDPGHGFYPNERGKVRFTVSPEARREILRRLLRLNLEIGREK